MIYRIRRRLQKSLDWLRGWFAIRIMLPFYKYLHIPVRNINIFERTIPFIERREYAQNKEDGIIHMIFSLIGTTNKYFVEFGVEDGLECNTRYLSKHKGWKGLLMDGAHEDPSINLHREFITAENIEELFVKNEVPKEFDLLSIDVDGNDYWIWEAITHYTPRVVIIEYNAHIPPEESKTIPYDPAFRWDGTDYYGVSLLALKKLGEQKGYTLIGTDSHGVNAFFIRNDSLQNWFAPPTWPGTYHKTSFKGKPGKGHPPDPQRRPWDTAR